VRADFTLVWVFREAEGSAAGASELEHFVETQDAAVLFPRIRLTPVTPVEGDLVTCNPHTNRDHRTVLRTSCASEHSLPPNPNRLTFVGPPWPRLKAATGDIGH
jgi:hypothetical protein